MRKSNTPLLLISGIVLCMLTGQPVKCQAYQSGTDSLTSYRALKMDTDNDGRPDMIGREVTVAGRANIGSGLLHESYLQIFIQTGGSGLSLFSESFDRPIQAGDSLVVSGKVQQYFGLTEIEVEDYRILPAQQRDINPIPLKKVITEPAPYEGMLVHGEGTVVEKGSRFNGKYLCISPSDSTDESIMVYVSNFHANYRDFDFETPSVGDEVELMGVLSQYNPDFPEERTYKVFLRTPDDLSYVGLPKWYLIAGGGVLLLTLALAGAWVVSLKIRVNSQTRKLRQTLDERELLLREIHHRLKNNLAIISGLIGLQEDTIEDDAARKVLQDTQTKIKAMAIIHDKLYQSNSLSTVTMDTYLFELAETIHGTISTGDSEIRLELQIEPLTMHVSKAIPLGLLLNEAMVNTYKHAYGDGDTGELRITLVPDGERYRLIISDNGRGFPDDFDPERSESLGMTLIQTFASQLQADMSIKNEEGATLIFSIPNPKDESIENL